mmetsp:Transcript_22578/g.33664  ORF Transcript_22578/g.33664 Transcript_22578/m.33664 type:complete len:160 (+) Transcript_22578:373-852(+)
MRNYYKPGNSPKKAEQKNPFGFQGFKNTGVRKNFKAKSWQKKEKDVKSKVDVSKEGDGRTAGRAGTKGSLASFMNKQLGVRTTGKTGLKKTVFETEEERKLHNPFIAKKSINQYKKNQESRQRMETAKSLGDIFMKGAKDKCTGKILLPSSLAKKKQSK